MVLTEVPPAPTWVDIGAQSSPGLDLLGLRLPVQYLGSLSLDGVTSVTPSVRYLSFLSWIAHSYASARRPDRAEDYRSFAASAETAIVLGNLLLDRGTPGLIGSDEGGELVDGNRDPLPLEPLVRQLAVRIYANPATQLGLVFPRESGVPGLTQERGLPLALAMADRAASCRLGGLLARGETIESARREDLIELGRLVAVRAIPDAERALLLAAILPPDPRDQDLPRIGSLALLLALASRHRRVPEESDLFEEARAPKRRLPPELHAALDGWLRYSVRDLLAAAGEAAFGKVLRSLEESGGTEHAVEAARVVEARVVAEEKQLRPLRELGLVCSGETLARLRFETFHQRIVGLARTPRAVSGGLARWTGGLDEWTLTSATLDGAAPSLTLLLAAWSLAVLRTEPWTLAKAEPFEGRAGLGASRMGLAEVVGPAVEGLRRRNPTLREAAAEIVYRVVDQHLRVAWSRMATDARRDVAALTSDESLWQRREKPVRAARTASRLAQAIGWLVQLELVGPKGLTAAGRRALDGALARLREASA